MAGVILKGKNAPRKLNELAREQMKTRLLADILIDMEICKLEGWDVTEHLYDVIDLLKKHIPNSDT
jgi:hypothetical protein